MNVTQVARREPGASSGRRPALLAAGGLALVGLALLVVVVVDEARLELLLAALGCVAGAALVTLLTD